MKHTLGEQPYSDYKIYGPIWHKNEERYMVCLVPINMESGLKRFTMSLARYKMATHLKRLLLKTEHVDHINGNKIDDRVENLQLLSHKDNNRKAFIEQDRTRKMVDMICPICNKGFTKEYNKTSFGKGEKYKDKINTCSRTCAAKLSFLDKKNIKNIVVRIYRRVLNLAV